MLHGLEIEVSPRAAVQEPADLPETLAWRIPMYRLLSAVFFEEPEPRFLEALRAPESLESLAEAGLAFDADFLAPDAAALAERLATEYASMFASSGGFPPIESARLTGRLKQEPYFDVTQTYARFGFRVAAGRFFVFEDQLGAELAFVAELLARAQVAHARDDADEYRRLGKEVKRFWTVHLGKWVRGYARLVQRAAEHSFYREMAKLLEAFAQEEIALLGLRIAEEEGGLAVVPKREIKVDFNPDEPVCGACPSGPQSVLARLEGSRAA